MQYKLKISSRNTLAIKITLEGNLEVLAPKKCSLKYIDDFVNGKEKWIQTHMQNVKQRQIIYQDFYSLNKLVVLGKVCDVVDYGNHYMVGDYYIKHTKASNKKNVLKKYINSLANEYILNRVKEVAKILNLEYKSAEIISARKKWGSCNNLKQLKFNFRLVMLPKGLIDYVICHELCHLKELNHSKEFWTLLEKIGYNKSDVKTKIKEYSFVLQML